MRCGDVGEIQRIVVVGGGFVGRRHGGVVLIIVGCVWVVWVMEGGIVLVGDVPGVELDERPGGHRKCRWRWRRLR